MSVFPLDGAAFKISGTMVYELNSFHDPGGNDHNCVDTKMMVWSCPSLNAELTNKDKTVPELLFANQIVCNKSMHESKCHLFLIVLHKSFHQRRHAELLIKC